MVQQFPILQPAYQTCDTWRQLCRKGGSHGKRLTHFYRCRSNDIRQATHALYYVTQMGQQTPSSHPYIGLGRSPIAQLSLNKVLHHNYVPFQDARACLE